jgi:hypothetical protein
MKPIVKAAQGGTPWQVEDDVQIQNAIRNDLDFERICTLFPSRSTEAVRHRIARARRTIHIVDSRRNLQTANTAVSSLWKAADQQSNGGRLWTTEELESLTDAIQDRHDLAHIRTMFPERSADSVRTRYNRTLREQRSQTARKPVPLLWSAEDDQKVRDAVLADIDRDEISAMFPKRTAPAVAFRIRKIKKGLENEGPEPGPAPALVDRGDNIQLDRYKSDMPDDQSVRSPSPPIVDHDYVIGAVPEDEEFTMSGALPVRQILNSPNPARIITWKAEAVRGLPRSSTPPTPRVELLAPAIEEWEYHFGDASYEPYVEGSGMWNNHTSTLVAVPNELDDNWDVDSDVLPDTRAFPETGTLPLVLDLPENDSAGNARQKQRRHPVLPKGSLSSTYPLIRPYPLYLSTPARVDNGYSRYILSVDDHPDLRDGLDFTPTPHHPVTPSNFVTSKQLFADSSVKPSVFMDFTASTTDELHQMFANYPPESDDGVAQSEDVVADEDMREE